jgi:cellulose synthase/poly-beta-1,6-N-acetylglucosamine synthase-like glycosyltransferase
VGVRYCWFPKIIKDMVDISVIIPSNHDHHDLFYIVRAVCSQTFKPFEIIVVDCSVEGGTCPGEIEFLCADSAIKLNYEYRELALPGDARNIGLGMATGELIAFIDVQTIPRPHWLEASLNLLAGQGAAGVLGATCFSAQTRFERLVRDGFHGVLPRRTLPGSVFRREVFDIAGQFINWVRAGEDTEWMLRMKVLKVPVVHSSSPLVDYVGLVGSDMKQLLKKWYRNHTASRDLLHFFPQKMLVWLVLYPLLVLIAFNWNYLLAGWQMDSPLYIGHVTKIVTILPALIYVIVRGLVLPLQRGVGIWQLLPARFLAIISICFMADFVKVLVFSLPKRKDEASTSGHQS